MDQQLLQRTRYQLQTRFRHIKTSEIGNFERMCQQVFEWLENHPILSSVLQHLDQVQGDHHEEIQLILNTDDNYGSRYYSLTVKKDRKKDYESEFKGYTAATLDQHASACLQVLRAAQKRPNLEFCCTLAIYLTREYYGIGKKKGMNDAFEDMRDKASHGLYEYLDEHLDGVNAVNGLMQKYKQSTEWFQREHLQQITEIGYEGKKGERALALHLQQYIFDQGVEFSVEPASVSGEADLVLLDPSGHHTIIDAKYIKSNFSRSDIVRKIAEGFNQVARYCNDHNQPEGFLAVFINDNINLNIELENNRGFNFLNVNNYVIYYIEINIAERPSASKSGKAKQITIAPADLFEQIKELQE